MVGGIGGSSNLADLMGMMVQGGAAQDPASAASTSRSAAAGSASSG